MADKSLIEQFLSKENLLRAYRRVAAKGASGGIDEVSIQDFGRHLDRNIRFLERQISEGRYTPQPVKSIHIPKFNEENEWRELGLPVVADKIVQAALLQVVEPLAEKIFLDTSYGYRPDKGHYKAIRRVEHNLKNRHKIWIAHRDIDNFFDTLNHDLLLSRFSDLVKGEPILTELVALWCRMGLVEKNGRWRNIEAGVRQGHVISPLLANLYLHPLDEFVAQFNIGWVRYADDCLIQCSSKEEAEDADKNVITFLKDNLSLNVNNNANPISNIESGFTFLGVYFCGEKRSMASTKLNKIHRKIKWLTSDKRSQTPEAFMLRLDKMLQGLKRYYGFLNPVEQFSEIDKAVENEIIPLIANQIKKGYWPQKPPDGIHLPLLIDREDPFAGFKKIRALWQEALKLNNPVNLEGIKKIADTKISKRRRRYRREHATGSELIVTTPGHFIGKRSERIVVRYNQKIITEMPAIRLSGITLASRGVSISGDVVELCMEKDIYIHFVDGFGNIVALIRPPGGTAGEISLLQVKERDKDKGLLLAKMFVLGKVKNQFSLLKYYHKYPVNRGNGFGRVFKERFEQMKHLIMEIKSLSSYETPETYRQQLMGLEGAFAVHYWACVKNLLHEYHSFEGRKREGAKDLVNSALNYGYGVLYSRVLNATIRAGLNPMSGFLHCFQDGKPVLVYDLIEEFRTIAVDRGIFTLLRRGEKLTQENDETLSSESRKKIARIVIGRLSSETFLSGRRMTLEDVLREQALNIKKHITGTSNYKPFLSRW